MPRATSSSAIFLAAQPFMFTTLSKAIKFALPASGRSFSSRLLSCGRLSCCLLSIAVLTAAHASADMAISEQMILEEIVVSAEKRDANLLDVASSISAKTAMNLQDAEISTITELAQEIPNLHIFSWGGRRDSNVFIRGIGPGLFTEPTVGYYVDGVNYSNNGMFDMDLVDVERVEVLRGPQGTLYGGNSLSGVINITTRQPGNDTEGRIQLSADSLSQKKLISSFSTPLKQESVFMGVSFSTLQSDGHIDNIFLNKALDERDDTTLRGKLRWLINENLEAAVTLDYEKFRGGSYAMGPAAFVQKNPERVSHDFEGEDDRDTLGTAVTVNWSGENVEFTSISSWRDWESLNSADQDTGSHPAYVYHSVSNDDQTQISQELRWRSKNSTGVRWIAGLYAYKSDFDGHGENTLDYTAFGYGGPYLDLNDTSKNNRGYAAFGQVDVNLAAELVLTAGLRFDHENRKAKLDLNQQSTGIVTTLGGEEDFDQFLPKIALSYTMANDGLLYASVSKGYRAGGFDTLYPNLEKPSYDSETSINYEVGYKAAFLDNRLEISVAAFLIDINDQQIQQLSSTTSTIFTDNAGESRSKGLEIESRFIPADGWLISLAGNYTDATFKEYDSINLATSTPEDYAGNRLPNSPNYTASFSIQNRQPLNDQLTLFTQVDSHYIGAYYFDAPNEFKQDAYHLLNAKVGLESENWNAYLWVKNALDEYYSKVEFNFGPGHTAEAGLPRYYGVTVSTQF